MRRTTQGHARTRPRTRATGLLLAAALLLPLSTAAAAAAAGAGHTFAGRAARAAATAARPPAPPPPLPPNPDNPLVGHPWGVYKGPGDQAWQPYERSRGESRRLLAKIALRPKATWFGAWTGDGEIERKVRDHVRNATGGDPRVLVQMTVFRMVPWEHEACRRLPSGREQASYRRWIDGFAAGVGSAHAAIVLQPDGPFALCVPHRSTLPSSLIAYAAHRFSALPHTSVYVDGGASDWPAGDPAASARMLLAAGVRDARGFALDSTHYVSTASDVDYGTRVVAELARLGAPGKHFVVNTSSNGQPFTFDRARGPNPDNAKACASRAERVCVTLGIPPTTDVANPRWGLSAQQRHDALAHVDGYLWFGRPWLHDQNSPFDLGRALALARTTPY